MTFAYWCVVFAIFLPLIWVGIAKANGSGYDNARPRQWLAGLWKRFAIVQEPLLTASGEIVAEPVFWFRAGSATYACFGAGEPRQRVQRRLEELGVARLEAGQVVPGERPAPSPGTRQQGSR